MVPVRPTDEFRGPKNTDILTEQVDDYLSGNYSRLLPYYVNFIVFGIMVVRISPVSVPCVLLRQLHRVQHHVRTYLPCLCSMCLTTSTSSCSASCSYVSHLSISQVSYYVNFIVFSIMFVRISPVYIPCVLICQRCRVQHQVHKYLTRVVRGALASLHLWRASGSESSCSSLR